MTPVKYFQQRRVERAKDLLRRGWSIDQVFRDAGYGTRRAFHRSFRFVTGTTPAAYRAEQDVP